MILNKLYCRLDIHEWEGNMTDKHNEFGFPSIEAECKNCGVEYNKTDIYREIRDKVKAKSITKPIVY